MANPHSFFRARRPDGRAGGDSPISPFTAHATEDPHNLGWPTSARDLLPSLAVISASEKRASPTHEGLKPDCCFIQPMRFVDPDLLHWAKPIEGLRSRDWTGRLIAANFDTKAGLLFTALTAEKIIALGGEWDAPHIRAARFAKQMQPAALDGMLVHLETLEPGNQEPWLPNDMTAAERCVKTRNARDRKAINHAFRIITGIYMTCKGLGCAPPTSHEYLFALRGVEDLDLILEARAEAVASEPLNSKLVPALSNSWRKLAVLHRRANDMFATFGPDNQSDEKPDLYAATVALLSVTRMVRYSLHNAHLPCKPSVKFVDEGHWKASVEDFVGRASVEKIKQALEEEAQDRALLKKLNPPARATAASDATRRRPSRFLDEDTDIKALDAKETLTGNCMSQSDKKKLGSDIAWAAFINWDKPKDLATIHRARYSAVALCDPTEVAQSKEMASKHMSLSCEPVAILDRAKLLRQTACPLDSPFDIPFGAAVKIVAGLISPDRHGFTLRHLAVTTSKNRSDRSGKPDDKSIWYTSDNLNWDCIYSLFHMLILLVEKGFMPRFIFTADAVYELWKTVRQLHYHYGRAMPPAIVFYMLERSLQEHVNDILDTAEARYRDGDTSTEWPSITAQIAQWPERHSFDYNKANADRQVHLQEDRARQAAATGPIFTDRVWVGKMLSAPTKKRPGRAIKTGGRTGKKPKV